MAIDLDRIHKPVRRLRRFIKKSPKRPSSGQIHDLRTSARRLETEISSIAPGRPRKNERRLLRHLAKVRKRAGKIRDMDVLVGDTLTVSLTGGLRAEQDCLVRLLETLGARRTKHVKKMRSLIAAIGKELRYRLKRTASRLEKFLEKTEKSKPNPQSDGPTSDGPAPDGSAEVMAQALRLAEGLKFPPRLTKKNLHPYRIKVKELRYVLQLADHADQQKFVEKLAEVSDSIGKWHDSEELTAIARDVLDHGAECQLLPKLSAIAESKYAKALVSREPHEADIHRRQAPAPRRFAPPPTALAKPSGAIRHIRHFRLAPFHRFLRVVILSAAKNLSHRERTARVPYAPSLPVVGSSRRRKRWRRSIPLPNCLFICYCRTNAKASLSGQFRTHCDVGVDPPRRERLRRVHFAGD